VTCASADASDALLIENRVLFPLMSLVSTSKYGSNRVAAGTTSAVPMSANA
jgi:hypothetical protein